MKITSRFGLEGFVLALSVAMALGCTSPTSSKGGTGGTNGTGTGGTNGTGTGGTNGTGTGGSSNGTGGSSNGTGGTTTTGTGGTTTTGTGGTSTGTGGTTTTGTGGTSTGTGGTTTGTGGTTTGTGGTTTGTGGTVQKQCATKTTIMTPVFMNFENYNGTSDPTMYSTAFGSTTVNMGNAYAGVYDYPEATGTTAPTLTIGGGHPPSTWAAGETLAATMWGMGGGIWMGCADASAYKGISFWVRGTSGTGTFTFTLSMDSTTLPDSTNAAGGGICPGTSDTCKPAEKDSIPISTDWTQVSILWSDFKAGMSGTTSVAPNGNNITGFGWNIPLAFIADPSKPADAGVYIPVAASVTFDIDDITFMQ